MIINLSIIIPDTSDRDDVIIHLRKAVHEAKEVMCNRDVLKIDEQIELEMVGCDSHEISACVFRTD